MFCLIPSTVFSKLVTNQADEKLNTYFQVRQRLSIVTFMTPNPRDMNC